MLQKKRRSVAFTQDEHPRETSIEALAKLKGVVRPDGSVTAGNASGVNDGACALLIASGEAATARPDAARAHRRHGHRRRGAARDGHRPGAGRAKAAAPAGMTLDQMDVIELNEAFAAQGLAVLRELGLRDDDARVNPNGGAIALGHPLGMSGARLVTTAMYQLHRTAAAMRCAPCASAWGRALRWSSKECDSM
jgi:acetyl-CoA acyltransferase